ncbi:Neurotransmitter-gated ion-channel ligand binding domain protein [Necator americanus]|uniref:Neurotransmitter-gated ion-channel ligand binding domain protein n=1 Tax=Necator americanus TaxID=51031 RepID=W2TAL7_NECAM|nr:Neurotransmitter-gated ion-channel ligand binding domain protein [Necator americanus]ETN78888.1 Neurotransmitter-gated ion-channel ligand binding domain protein [Necator americanus]
MTCVLGTHYRTNVIGRDPNRKKKCGRPHNEDAKRLYDDLMVNYNRHRRPASGPHEPLTIKLKLRLSQIIDVHEIDQIMTCSVWLKQVWIDKKLSWDPKSYGGVSVLYVPYEMIWVPDIVLYNKFPFDEQQCHLKYYLELRRKPLFYTWRGGLLSGGERKSVSSGKGPTTLDGKIPLNYHEHRVSRDMGRSLANAAVDDRIQKLYYSPQVVKAFENICFIAELLKKKDRDDKALPVLVCSLLIYTSVTYGNQDAKRLFDDLMKNYNRHKRPAAGPHEPTTIKLKLRLSQLIDVHEIDQIMTCSVWLKQVWMDRKLSWDPKNYGGVSVLYVPYEMIWVPDIVLYNKWK